MKKITLTLSLIILSFLLCGCSGNTTSEPTLSPTATLTEIFPTNTTAPTVTSTSAPLTTPIPNENGLTIEENEIIGPPRLDPLTFKSVYGSQQEILERHAAEKGEPYPFSARYSATDEDHTYEASEDFDNEDRVTVVVKRDGETIFEVDAGDGSPITPLRGLWIEDGQWVLEFAYITTTTVDNGVYTDAVGWVYRDGASLNGQFGYEEMFGYQLLDGKPFYFYQQDGQIHLSYDGEDLPITYDEVPHYRCCSGGQLNPVAGSNWIGFWGIRDEVWYYTEIGRY